MNEAMYAYYDSNYRIQKLPFVVLDFINVYLCNVAGAILYDWYEMCFSFTIQITIVPA